MDQDEERVTGTACKRQKRNNTSEDDGYAANSGGSSANSNAREDAAADPPSAIDVGDAAELVGAAQAATDNLAKTTENSNNNNNNNNNNGKDSLIVSDSLVFNQKLPAMPNGIEIGAEDLELEAGQGAPITEAENSALLTCPAANSVKATTISSEDESTSSKAIGHTNSSAAEPLLWSTDEEDGEDIPFSRFRLSNEAASAVLAAPKHFASVALDSDDDAEAGGDAALEQRYEGETDAAAAAAVAVAVAAEEDEWRLPYGSHSPNSLTFIQRNIPPTRSYRRINIELSMSPSSDSSASNSAVSDRLEAASNASDGAEAGNATDAPSLVTPDDSSSSSSDLLLPRNHSDVDNLTSDSDSEDDLENLDYNVADASSADREQIEFSVAEVLCKSKPPYTWNFTQELMHREHNITNRIGWRGGHTSAQSFAQGFYGSRQVVERMSRMCTLRRHNGCVNCLNFNRAGDLVCSGSDDLRIIVWDWANQRVRHCFKSGHTRNIFQTKFIDSAGCLDIVSASRDGQVRRAVIPPSGGSTKPTRLYTHSDAVHKIVVVPHSRHEIMSAGEDSAVKHFDLRTSTAATTLLRCTRSCNESRVPLFSIAHHPYAPEFCVSGCDDKLRVYDKRKISAPVHEMSPKRLVNKIKQITCAVYNHSGSEILASYSDAGIYLYDSRNYKDGECLHCYEGHINSRTIKGVNFFGPHSEYVVSGSDCGHIFFWDKSTESIVNFMKGDHSGVVNCLEPHPWMPVLATSGLEHNVKIWTPTGKPYAPEADKLETTLRNNFRRNILDTGDFDINQFHYFIRQFLEGNPSNYERMRRNRDRAEAASADEQPEQDQEHEHEHNSNSSSATTTSSASVGASSHHSSLRTAAGARRSRPPGNDSSSDEGDDVAALEALHCRTQ